MSCEEFRQQHLSKLCRPSRSEPVAQLPEYDNGNIARPSLVLVPVQFLKPSWRRKTLGEKYAVTEFSKTGTAFPATSSDG